MPAPFEGIFTGGQMTDLPPFLGGVFDGTELMEIVSPGNAAAGVNYGITIAQLAALIPGYSYVNTILTTGATVGTPYVVPTTVTRLLLNKTIPSASYVVLSAASTYPLPVLIRDLAGNASSNPITVTFNGSETCDGLTSVVIGTDFGGYWFNPLKTGNWYLGTA